MTNMKKGPKIKNVQIENKKPIWRKDQIEFQKKNPKKINKGPQNLFLKKKKQEEGRRGKKKR